MNKVLVVGRLTRDPETNITGSNIKYTRFSVAVSRPYGDDQADFIPIIAWRSQADFVEKYMEKGSLVSVEGRFSSSSYQNQDGQNITRYEVTADRVQSLESKAQRENRTGNTQEFVNPPTQAATQVVEFEAENKPAEEVKEKETNTDVPWDLDL